MHYDVLDNIVTKWHAARAKLTLQICKSVLLYELSLHIRAGANPFCSPVLGQSIQTVVPERSQSLLSGMLVSAQIRPTNVAQISPVVSTTVAQIEYDKHKMHKSML